MDLPNLFFLHTQEFFVHVVNGFEANVGRAVRHKYLITIGQPDVGLGTLLLGMTHDHAAQQGAVFLEKLHHVLCRFLRDSQVGVILSVVGDDGDGLDIETSGDQIVDLSVVRRIPALVHDHKGLALAGEGGLTFAVTQLDRKDILYRQALYQIGRPIELPAGMLRTPCQLNGDSECGQRHDTQYGQS